MGNKSENKVIGLDLSLRSTGIGWTDYKTGEISTECFRTDANVRKIVRMLRVSDAVRKAVEKYPSGTRSGVKVFIEDYAWKGKGNVQDLAELGGVVKSVLWREYRIDPIPVGPSTIKKWLTGNGRAQKDLMLLGVYKKYGMEYDNSDQADAHALTDLAWSFLNADRLSNLTKSQLACLDAVAKKIKE